MPADLAFDSLMEPDPDAPGGWRITTDERVIQRIPEDEFRFLVHWGASLYMDLDDLRTAFDHTDDLMHERVFDILLDDLRQRGEKIKPPSNPLTDKEFIRRLNDAYGIDRPLYFPPEPDENVAAWIARGLGLWLALGHRV
jgi:hypothetical protein